MSEASEAPVGFIYHWSSGIVVHPYGGSPEPRNDTKLVTYTSREDEYRLQVRFVPVKGAGHFGYIEHVPSSKIVHPLWGKPNPRNNTALVYHSDRHDRALFAFDEENHRILHIGGKNWHPKGGKLSPSNNTVCVLHSDSHNAAKFYFGDSSGNPISPYPEKLELGGGWKKIAAFIAPKLSRSYTFKLCTGRSLTKSVTDTKAWNLNAKLVRKSFKADATYSSFARQAESCTWSDEKVETNTLDAEKGNTVVVWQYVFVVGQYGEEWSFRSSITANTNSMDETPMISALLESFIAVP